MSNELATISQKTIEQLVLSGDLSSLNSQQRVEYYLYRCKQLQLDPATKPFDILSLNGKWVLYANATCTQQLICRDNLSTEITGREIIDGIYCVYCRVTGSGRTTENMGAVNVEGLKGDARANAYLKATTKAIRRSVLAHCSVGMLDETEIEPISDAKAVSFRVVENNNEKGVIQPIVEYPQESKWTQEEQYQAHTLLDVKYHELKQNQVENFERLLDKAEKAMHTITYEQWLQRLEAMCGNAIEQTKTPKKEK